MEYYSVLEKKEILPFETTGMDLEDVMLSDISDTARQVPSPLTYEWNL